ncbi:MAG: hypothetical protein GY805_17690 [Chloroflexi bacterium]|nr:hypothetical protein [Chloroflexota bacterium]
MLHLLPTAELRNDMTWANASPIIADAFGRWTAVIEAAGATAWANFTAARHIGSWP